MSLLCCRFAVYPLFLQVRKGFVYCKGTIKDNNILIGLCKAPLPFSGSKLSMKLFIAHVEQVQGERHAKFGEKARVELEKSAAKRDGCVGLGIVLRTLSVCSSVSIMIFQ